MLLLLLEFEDELELLLLELFEDEFDEEFEDELFELLLLELLELLLLELLELLLLELLELFDELLLELFDSHAILKPDASATFIGADTAPFSGIAAWAEPAASAPAANMVNLVFITLSNHDFPVPGSGGVQQTGDLGKIAVSSRSHPLETGRLDCCAVHKSLMHQRH